MLDFELHEVECFLKGNNACSSIFACFDRIKTALVVAQNTPTNKRYTQCPKCGSTRLCFWMCHDTYGCYDCSWIEGHSA